MKRKALLILGLSVTLACTNAVSVYAAGGGNHRIEAYSNNNNNKVKVAGNEETDISGDVSVTGYGEIAVQTFDNAKVSVKGNVSVEGDKTKGVESNFNSSVSVQGNVSASGESAEGVAGCGNSSVKVSGGITAEGQGPLGVSSEKGSSVTVDGTVKAAGSRAVGINSKGEVTAGGVLVEGADSTGVLANNSGRITINNDVKVVERNRGTYSGPVSGVEAESNGKVTVKGNVEVVGIGAMGINSTQGVVNVNGNVKVSGTPQNNQNEETVGISAKGSNISVKGNVASDGKGIHIIKSGTGLNSIVEVNGSVTGSSGVVTNNGSDVTVGGDVTATGGTGLDITMEEATGRGIINLGTLNVTKEGETGVLLDVRKRNIQDIDELIQAMPEVNLFEINVKQGDYFGINDGTNRDTIQGTSILKKEAADKILKQKVNYHLRAENTSNGTISLDHTKATEGTTVKFYVKAVDGYQVKGVSAGKATVIDNGDGSYSIIVPRGGGVNISAIIEAVMKEEQGGQSAASNEKYSASFVKYAVGQKQAQQLIKSVAPGGNCVVELEDFVSFNRKTLEALAKRPDVSMTVIYKWNGVKYKVTIPAGYNVLDLLNEDGYCGCLYLNAIFGSEVVE